MCLPDQASLPLHTPERACNFKRNPPPPRKLTRRQNVETPMSPPDQADLPVDTPEEPPGTVAPEDEQGDSTVAQPAGTSPPISATDMDSTQ